MEHPGDRPCSSASTMSTNMDTYMIYVGAFKRVITRVCVKGLFYITC